MVMTIASVGAGWGPDGWQWGALAGGTLIHYLRFTVGRTRVAPFAALMATSAGFGLPFLPTLLAQLEGVTAAPRWLAAVVLIGILAGLAARAGMTTTVQRRAATVADEARAAVVVSFAAVVSVCALVLTLPRPAAATSVAGPPAWSVAVVFAAGLLGALIPRVVTPAARKPWRPTWPDLGGAYLKRIESLTTARVLWAAVGVLAAAAAGMWVVGFTRGFL